ncbi:MAG: phage holin [Lachnospiraceae bacterium]|nr:phage holin [Lachnospiraceae bacterium]
MKFKLPDKVYDKLKMVALVFLPALATLVGSLFGIWNIGYAQEIVKTITALDLFLGAVLGISSAQYKKDMEENNG